MKKIALISLFIVLSAALFAQNWFRDGATWTFNDQQEFTYQAHGYDKYTVVGDTILNDTAAKQIVHKSVSYTGTESGGNIPSIIVHESNSRVFTIGTELNL